MTDRTRARIHAMFNLDEAAEKELDSRLDALVAATEAEMAKHVLWCVEQSAGDQAAEQVRDNYPYLEAGLRGEPPAEEPPLDLDALDAKAEAEKIQVCGCGHFRDKHFRDFHRGGIACGTCDCPNFTAR